MIFRFQIFFELFKRKKFSEADLKLRSLNISCIKSSVFDGNKMGSGGRQSQRTERLLKREIKRRMSRIRSVVLRLHSRSDDTINVR